MIGNHENTISDIAVGDAGRKGLGVFALRTFRKGEFIFRRRHGRIVRRSDLGLLSDDERRHLCELDLDTSAVLLPPGTFSWRVLRDIPLRRTFELRRLVRLHSVISG